MIEYKLKLYIKSGATISDKTCELITQFCSNDTDGLIDLKVIDVNRNPRSAEEDKILLVPTLIISSPPPARRIIGEITDIEMLMKILDLKI